MSLIKTLAGDPLAQLDLWLKEAIQRGLEEPTAMTLATVSKDGVPSARMVLCKGIESDGIHFYTNYESRKASELTARPVAALVFFWQKLQRQVRVEGTVERLSRSAAEAYFKTRPRGSQIGAWASAQSRPIATYATLVADFERIEREYEGKDVPCPPHWGGFTLMPNACEFWEGKTSRLHDRVLCTLRANPAGGRAWDFRQLAP